MEYGSRANDLRAETVLRPAHGVDDGGNFLGVAVLTDGGEQVGGFQELFLGDAGDALDHFRRIARVMFLQKLEDAVGILQGQIVVDFFRQGR